MAGRLEDEEYWHASEAKAFSFEDDEFGSQLCGVSKSGTARLSQRVREGMGIDSTYVSTDSLSGSLSRATISDSSQTAARPLQTLISEKSLLCILEAGNFHEKQPKGKLSPEEEVRILRRQVENRWVPPPVNDTVAKILLGYPYSLELYRSLKSKTELLDAAIAVGDGNAILAVVLFLVRTLKKNLVYQLLRTRPEAVAQYCQYLAIRLRVHELTDLLEMLGDNREASMKQFQLAVCGTMNPQRRLQKLQACFKNHFSLTDNKDRLLIENYIKLLEWQLSMAGADAEIAKALVGQPVLSSLAYTCQHHWSEPKGSISAPLTLSQQQGVSDRQFQWTVLTVRASLHSWDDIEGLFITKSWLGGKKLKAAVSMEQVVMQLHAHGAPVDVLVKYLELIDNVDKRVGLAQKLQCHKAVVNVFVAKRDRQALISYKANLHPQSEDYFYAENSLRVSTTKWKN
ncbi:spermatogenesis-defective protein 39 homolog isoform X2 [Zootermopsis nevadensis]|uniref:spermatogenesis-defective protein 39 homolog isoform X2 n=1 Tax=Zootermopsis nevadensis TaxID=136037 RepID=UPI000B8E9BCD|nr:spermatogenesis-defective protein 39 homolog isoform X2 [Zootermopsis nevadensis]